MATTNQDNRWLRIKATWGEVTSILDSFSLKRNDIVGVETTGTDINIIAWRGHD